MKKVTLEEAKRILLWAEGKIYENASGETFNLPSFGSGDPNLSFIIPTEWYITEWGKEISPVEWQNMTDVIKDSLHLSFKESYLLWGDYYLSKNGKGCFKIKKADEAKHILVEIPFKNIGWWSRTEDEKELKKKYEVVYHRITSIGKQGYEYFVFPTSLIPKAYLKNLAQKREQEFLENERKYNEREAKERESKKNKPLFEDRLLKIVDELKQLKANIYRFEIKEEGFEYNSSYNYYTEESMKMLEGILEDERELKSKRDKYIPLFKKAIGNRELNVAFCHSEVELRDGGHYYFKYSDVGVSDFFYYLRREVTFH